MMRQRFRREHPDAGQEEIRERLTAWLQTRPGAENGDAQGTPVAWPRPSR
jgi:Rv0078B-related antitoxin